MSNFRTPGSQCTIRNSGQQPRIGTGVPRSQSAQPGSIQDSPLTKQEQELALDVVQLSLDIAGIFEPTPFADGASALISIGRGDWFGAAISGLGIIPYIGDLAKAGKLPKYVATLNNAITVAQQNANFARYLRPALIKLYQLLDTIPVESLTPKLANIVESLKRPLNNFLGAGKVADDVHGLQALTQRLLYARGFSKNVAEMVRKNVETTARFLQKNGISEDRMVQVLSGIDLHALVEVVKLKKGMKMIQAYDPVRKMGSWFIKAGGGVGTESVGIAKGFRQNKIFEISQPVEMLKSRATSVIDDWTPGAIRPGSEALVRKSETRLVLDQRGKIDISSGTAKIQRTGGSYGVGAQGGGTQYYFPQMVSSKKTGNAAEGAEYYKGRWTHFMKEWVPPKK